MWRLLKNSSCHFILTRENEQENERYNECCDYDLIVNVILNVMCDLIMI